ncbi:TPA: hypothetical protein DHT42_00885 [Candidatus Nomurabacteria bacterium]|nr:MAG: hypothetical protein UV94_C0003G0007 [Parcubacteria group bacterium GW2011_GWC1_43_30]KKT80799.1 MAG: hypothetical protein UW76_C0005G0011 [Parcubacteria group bacterium GW2011_GWF2_44_8b]KKT85593.1 MAG: hypothetical protein UW83_C0013G0007 [Parcubacteria group bacterium GW2011_GWD1_44_9]HCY17744.1 hypothetical protein [Candidatus Nomurabacteria bacterium]
MSNVDAKIKITFREFKDIFENWDKNYPPSKKSGDGRVVYIPDENVEIHNNLLNGLKLKNEVGFITIQQTIDKNGEPVSYIYRFVSSEYEYLICKRNVNNCDNQGNFYFHFDKCEDDRPHKPHISVMSPPFRYISNHIELKEFLEFIRDNFYSPRGNVLIKKENILANRL